MLNYLKTGINHIPLKGVTSVDKLLLSVCKAVGEAPLSSTTVMILAVTLSMCQLRRFSLELIMEEEVVVGERGGDWSKFLLLTGCRKTRLRYIGALLTMAAANALDWWILSTGFCLTVGVSLTSILGTGTEGVS